MVKLTHICFLCLFLMIVISSPVSAQQGTQTDNPSLDNRGTTAPGQDSPAQEMTDIYDIKPPALFGVNPVWIKYAVAILGILLFLVLLFVTYKYWKKKKRPVESITAQLSPEDKANASLRDIKALMMENGKEFYFRLSAVYRGYIQDRYGIEALEMTSEELLPEIKRLNLDETLKTDSRSFIVSSDPVKFTDMTVDAEQMETHYRFVHSFVEKTTPVPTVLEMAENEKSDG